MADILQDFPIAVAPAKVYEAVSRPAGLNEWWTKTASGIPTVGEEFRLDFGPGYQWRAIVMKARAAEAFELRMTSADDDWNKTLVGFELAPQKSGTLVRFYHRNWPSPNEHYRISTHCWALYLRILRRHLEFGESVPYEKRLGA
jgi:uncharacterized protein YndB with AHSA1/START domain